MDADKHITAATFNKDTNAATFRHYYVIPESAVDNP